MCWNFAGGGRGEWPCLNSNSGAEGVESSFQWCLVGRSLTKKMYNFQALRNTIASVWRQVKGVCIKELGANLYFFQFFHELDYKRVIK